MPARADYVIEALRSAMSAGRWERVGALASVLDDLDTTEAARPAALVSAALWYAERGLPVFPCQHGAKVPHKGSNGVLEASCDPDTIRRWWLDHPGSNVAIATGHVLDVLDFDGALGHESWGRVFDDPVAPYGTDVAVLATVSTPRPGGLHVYIPATGKGNRAGFVEGVDYRGRGGYVVAPPSSTPNGAYRFLRPIKEGMSPYE